MTDAMLRHFLGFDPAMFQTADNSYPRYNIVKNESETEQVTVEVAVPGFYKEDITVQQDGNKLSIKAKQVDWLSEGEEYLHKGFSSKGFDKSFVLGEFMEVSSVSLNYGVLSITIEKNIPEEKRPKTFSIQ